MVYSSRESTAETFENLPHCQARSAFVEVILGRNYPLSWSMTTRKYIPVHTHIGVHAFLTEKRKRSPITQKKEKKEKEFI
ncbi:hypothetical protein POVCU2_0019620 [Plasmodium ovale curtisi]|uniref:Uncharacterized protein n=1 Tax=Plasmodium ovale curtisi TaxID=864141 RepID=A0A1A8VRR7_PLAOA|nr:hypothetical protein POVCU2_0019620 [Plasmodium ovale curtisi]